MTKTSRTLRSHPRITFSYSLLISIGITSFFCSSLLPEAARASKRRVINTPPSTAAAKRPRTQPLDSLTCIHCRREVPLPEIKDHILNQHPTELVFQSDRLIRTVGGSQLMEYYPATEIYSEPFKGFRKRKRGELLSGESELPRQIRLDAYIYVGQYRKNSKKFIREGQGVTVSGAGFRYEGMFANGKPTRGTITIKDQKDSPYSFLGVSEKMQEWTRHDEWYGILSLPGERGSSFEGQFIRGRPTHGALTIKDPNAPNPAHRIQSHQVNAIMTKQIHFSKPHKNTTDPFPSVYEGGIENLVPHGQGKMSYIHRKEARQPLKPYATYEGQWSQGHYTVGKFEHIKKGEVHEGTFSQEQLHGHGTVKTIPPDSSKQEVLLLQGQFEKGLLHGQGTKNYYVPTQFGQPRLVGKYEGNFEVGFPKGEGIYRQYFPGKPAREFPWESWDSHPPPRSLLQHISETGNVYHGEWKYTPTELVIPHGRGTAYLTNGAKQTGVFEEGVFQAQPPPATTHGRRARIQ